MDDFMNWTHALLYFKDCPWHIGSEQQLAIADLTYGIVLLIMYRNN